ncbi:MATE family efflux transporter [Alteromonas sp. 5E99-2]|uniref:MATE family efflux transporter n=1 Tax=Alteromonas sp. 5E99-2 TaxID=2817683 RepID=UPI001A98525A|nr:MATE family efflux transporter [Alteromonas sp. 5E99-2]MBO1255546.1 MATE family efflux transporter [Alteromonas sp. 5E99-2]
MIRTEAKALVALAWPLLIAQLTQIFMGVSDTIMAGQYNATDMAGVAVGFSFVHPAQIFIQGLALALPPIISRLQGAKKDKDIANATQQVGYVLFSVMLVFFCTLPFLESLIALVPMSEELRPITSQYVFYLYLSLPGFALYQWLRNYAEGLGLTKPTMMITLIGLCINILANYILIYGKFGLPEMGGSGCGLATCAVFYGMLLANLMYVLNAKKLKPFALFQQWHRPHLATMFSSFTLGFPIALTLLFEVSLFALVAILLAPLGTVSVAAHQIALNISAMFFMFPLSLGMAVAIRISYRLGQGDHLAAKHAAQSALLIGITVALLTALITVFGRHFITHAYTEDPAVLSLAASLLILGAVFQFSDAIQAISANSLRGYKDTTAMFVITFISYWLIGLPIGIVLAKTSWLTSEPLAASGFWIGFIAGLSSAAVMLGFRLHHTQRKALSPPVH